MPPAFIALSGISIHALRGEGDACRGYYLRLYKNFNPRPPWGGRLYTAKDTLDYIRISIHALRGEGDNELRLNSNNHLRFQSTPSVGRATGVR